MKKVVFVLLASLIGFTSYPTVAMADNSKNEKKVSTSSSKNLNQSTTSNWILPAAPNVATNAIEVEAGSTIPLKFQLFNAGNELKNGTVTLTTSVVTPCPINVKTPTPVATKLESAKPGKSQSAAPRYQGKSWNVSWKSDKGAQGCFKIRATHLSTNIFVESPIFVIYPKSK